MANGFEEFQEILKKLTPEKGEVVQAQTEAAMLYEKKLAPRVPRSALNKHHMRGDTSVVKDGDEVKVVFNDDSYYWRFVEHGTNKIRAQNFARNTLNSNIKEISKVLTKKFIK